MTASTSGNGWSVAVSERRKLGATVMAEERAAAYRRSGAGRWPPLPDAGEDAGAPSVLQVDDRFDLVWQRLRFRQQGDAEEERQRQQQRDGAAVDEVGYVDLREVDDEVDE